MACVYDKVNASLYINGELKASQPFTEDLGQGQSGVTVGGFWDHTGLQKHFAGSLDEVRIHNYACTAAQIAAEAGFSRRYHPADSNQDGCLVINEVTAYGAAWKLGNTWPTPPNPIDINYVTRAGYLWKNGEGYRDDGSAEPNCWVPDTGRR